MGVGEGDLIRGGLLCKEVVIYHLLQRQSNFTISQVCSKTSLTSPVATVTAVGMAQIPTPV